MTTRLTAVLALLLASVAGAEAPPAPTECATAPEAGWLDFWIGDWEVLLSDGQPAGADRVTRELAGCALVERWRAARGGEGLSLFWLDPADRAWRQVWVTDQAFAPAGAKEKRLTARSADGRSVTFQGHWTHPSGRRIHDRTVLTALDDGRVRQEIAWSADGETWQVSFVGLYIRRRD